VFGTAAQELKASGHGRGWTWVTQQISPRWFDDAATAVTPEVRQQIEQAVHRIIEHIYGR
jgi:Ni,Fe-hydrogenase maturation factor